MTAVDDLGDLVQAFIKGKNIASEEQSDRETFIQALGLLGGDRTAIDDVFFESPDIPETGNLRHAATVLSGLISEEEEAADFSRTFRYRPWDGARAATAVLKRRYGLTVQQAVQSFFGPVPPKLVTVNIGVNETEQIPWGEMTIPMLPNCVVMFDVDTEPMVGQLFHVTITGPKKLKNEVEAIFADIEKELQANSMYRGKAFDGKGMPEFLDLSTVDPDKVIYADDVAKQLTANVWSMLRYSEAMEDNGIPLKRTVLLEGPYGSGKTLAAFLTAQEAVANGWTFIYCRPGHDNLAQVMSTAQLYQPAVVFFEDIDVVANPDDTNADAVTRLLDTFDGMQSKGMKILGVLTTNHPEKIHKGMVRPGRLDAVIHIGALDLKGVTKLVCQTVPVGLLDGDVDFEAVFAAMKDYLPAFCKEAIDRSVRYSIARGQGVASKISRGRCRRSASAVRHDGPSQGREQRSVVRVHV